MRNGKNGRDVILWLHEFKVLISIDESFYSIITEFTKDSLLVEWLFHVEW